MERVPYLQLEPFQEEDYHKNLQYQILLQDPSQLNSNQLKAKPLKSHPDQQTQEPTQLNNGQA